MIITSDDNFSFYYESSLDSENREVNISVINSLDCDSEKLLTGGTPDRVILSSKDMDKIATAWIKERKLERLFGGPVGKEFGSPDCDYR